MEKSRKKHPYAKKLYLPCVYNMMVQYSLISMYSKAAVAIAALILVEFLLLGI